MLPCLRFATATPPTVPGRRRTGVRCGHLKSILLLVGFALCATAQEQPPLTSNVRPRDSLAVRQVRYRVHAGEARPLSAPRETIEFLLNAKQLRVEGSDRNGRGFAVGPSVEGNELLIAAPLTMQPGEYRVTLVGTSAAGEDRSAALEIFLSGLPAIPLTAKKPPVVLLNGFQPGILGSCPISSSSTGTFAKLEGYLKDDGVPAVIFFDNCKECPNCMIEDLGNHLGQVLNAIRYDTGAPVPEIDVVAHSMGGLIARSYLAGLQSNGTITPPADPRLRKLVLIATPNFGSFQASAIGTQLSEMSLGSTFLWRLATWNQGWDDLRGIDSIAVIGNAGSKGSTPNLGDGVGSLTSASLRFSAPDQRTRIVPYCHTDPGFLSSLGMSCSSAAGIANISDESQLTGRIIRSFLADTADWQSIGTVPSRNPYLSSYSGAFFGVLDPNGDPYSDVSSAWFGSQSSPLNRGPSSYLFSEFLPAKSDSFVASLRGSSYSMSYAVLCFENRAVRIKFGA